MSKVMRKLLGFILLLSTVGLVTCQSMVKAEENHISSIARSGIRL